MQPGNTVRVTQQSINKYKNHKVYPDIAALITLADYFNTSVDYLIGHTEIPNVIEPIEKYDLNREESELIENYRRLSDKQKAAVQAVTDSYTK